MKTAGPMKGVIAALTPPDPNENRSMATASPAAAALSCCIAAGIEVNWRIRAPRRTTLSEHNQPRMRCSLRAGNIQRRYESCSVAAKPRICNNCSKQRSKIRKGHETTHDKRSCCLLQAQCSWDLAMTIVLKIVFYRTLAINGGSVVDV